MAAGGKRNFHVSIYAVPLSLPVNTELPERGRERQRKFLGESEEGVGGLWEGLSSWLALLM